MPTLREINTTNPTTTMNNLTEGSLVDAAVLYCPKNGTTTLTTCTADVDDSGRVKVACRQNGVFSKYLKFVHDADSGMNKTKNIYHYYQKRRVDKRTDYVPSFVQLRKGKYYKVKFDEHHNPVETNEVVVVVAEEEGLVGVGNNEEHHLLLMEKQQSLPQTTMAMICLQHKRGKRNLLTMRGAHTQRSLVTITMMMMMIMTRLLDNLVQGRRHLTMTTRGGWLRWERKRRGHPMILYQAA